MTVSLNAKLLKRDGTIGDFKGQDWLTACTSGTIHFFIR